MKKKYLALVLSAVLLTACSSDELVRKSFFAMDVYGGISVPGSSAANSAMKIIGELDAELSNYNPQSKLYKLNHREISKLSSEDISALIEKTNVLSEQYGDGADITAGALTELWGIATDSPYLPTREEALQAVSTIGCNNVKADGKEISLSNGAKLDFGCVAKGYACDRIRECFDEKKVPWGIVSLDSSALLYGEKPDGLPFAVEIESPEGGESPGKALVYSTCLSSSGGYERYFEVDGERFIHIFDLETGFPVETDLTSVTVFCQDGTKSDFLSTLIFTEGTKSLEKYLADDSIQIIAIDNERNIYCSEDLIFIPNENSGFTLVE